MIKGRGRRKGNTASMERGKKGKEHLTSYGGKKGPTANWAEWPLSPNRGRGKLETQVNKPIEKRRSCSGTAVQQTCRNLFVWPGEKEDGAF